MNLKETLRKNLENRLVLVPTDLGDFYVKRLNVGEMNDLIFREEAIDGGENKPFAGEAKFALRLLDEQGKQVFDEHNQDDLALIAEIPFAVRAAVDNVFFSANFGGVSKNG